MSEPGTAATASVKSSTRAVRIEVSCAHRKRSVPRQPSRGRSGPAGSGCGSSAWSAGRVWVWVMAFWVLGDQIGGVKVAKVARRSAVMNAHSPLTSSSPTTTMRMPPVRIRAVW